MPRKSYWGAVSVRTDRDKIAVKSWFDFLCEDMTPYKAEALCDIETDREKKFRAFMTDADGNAWQFERSLGGRQYSISRKRVANAKDLPPKDGAVASAARA